jgi:drug/metabolite transporter (DMT)-like permease
MWIFYALLSGLFSTGSSLISRHILKDGKNDVWAFSSFYSAIGCLVSLPFMLSHIKIATTLSPWLLMILVGVLIVIHNLLNFSSSKYIPPSISGSISKFRLVWILLLGIVLLQESSNVFKIVGTLLTVIAGIIVTQKMSKPKNMRGILYALLATIFNAIIIILYKLLFTSFNSQSLTFFIFFIPTILNIFIMPNSLKRIYMLTKSHFGMVLLSCVMGGVANLAMNQGLSLGEASKVLVVIESFLVITLLGEHIILKEKDHLISKIIGVLCATAGAILIRLS